MNTKSYYQIAIFEKDTDNQVSFCDKTTTKPVSLTLLHLLLH